MKVTGIQSEILHSFISLYSFKAKNLSQHISELVLFAKQILWFIDIVGINALCVCGCSHYSYFLTRRCINTECEVVERSCIDSEKCSKLSWIETQINHKIHEFWRNHPIKLRYNAMLVLSISSRLVKLCLVLRDAWWRPKCEIKHVIWSM